MNTGLKTPRNKNPKRKEKRMRKKTQEKIVNLIKEDMRMMLAQAYKEISSLPSIAWAVRIIDDDLALAKEVQAMNTTNNVIGGEDDRD